MTVFVGIDPGFTGAIAFYWPDSNSVEVHDMPVYKNIKGKTELNLYELHEILTPEGDEPHHVILEQVAAMRGQGVSSMFLRRNADGYCSAQAAHDNGHAGQVEVAPWPEQRQRSQPISRKPEMACTG